MSRPGREAGEHTGGSAHSSGTLLLGHCAHSCYSPTIALAPIPRLALRPPSYYHYRRDAGFGDRTGTGTSWDFCPTPAFRLAFSSSMTSYRPWDSPDLTSPSLQVGGPLWEWGHMGWCLPATQPQQHQTGGPTLAGLFLYTITLLVHLRLHTAAHTLNKTHT